MRLICFKTISALIMTFMLFIPVKSYSQIVESTGNPTKSSSQLIYYYDQFEDNTALQVTNTNDTQGVWIHVQIFRNFDADPDSITVSPVICDERNFVDFLTPNDTHVYTLDETNFPKNIGENEADAGESTTLDINNTKGFVVITSVVSESDLSAISFEFLIGSTTDDDITYRMNAMGRSAVDFTTGDVIEAGTPLDGITNGFVLIQPEELIFDFAGDGDPLDVVGIAFEDVYGEPGLLGYQVDAGDATWNSFIFDFKEDPTSCGIRTVSCFLTLGLNDSYEQNNQIFIPAGSDPDLLCSGADTPEYDPNGESSFENVHELFGWTRIFISGVSGLENHLGIFNETNSAGARWMNSNKEILNQ